VRFNSDYERHYFPKIDHHEVPSDTRSVVPEGWKPKKDPKKEPK